MRKLLLALLFLPAISWAGGGQFQCVNINNLGQLRAGVYNGPTCALKNVAALTQPCYITNQGWVLSSGLYYYKFSYSGSGCGNVSGSVIGWCQDKHYEDCEILDTVESNFSGAYDNGVLYQNFGGV